MEQTISQSLLKETKIQSGESLWELSQNQTLMIFFLRHFGCIFCREALRDIENKRLNWEKLGIKIVMVHPTDEKTGKEYFSQFNLSNVWSIADPECKLYSSFGLIKGSFTQLFGLSTMIRGFSVASKGILPQLSQVGDSFQMPGIFIVSKGQLMDSYIHKNVSDRPDYETLIQCCAA